MRLYGAGFLLPVFLLAAAGTSAAALDSGLWIVAGSFRNPDYSNFQTEAVRKASAAVRRCGLAPFNDFSGKFRGFAEGHDVVVVGPYRTRAEADAVLRRLKPCVPDAFVKQGRYLGE
ncbi:SPOR domain-containing protein [Methylorubrum extorquens]|jgi:hypothetical protein|uniref:Sporulation domain-containing protein n=1 Tax=Methylorubrum extorquens DSM 13060 TaxID=882800 RepID=H1KQ76_METEX|nr:SPOR domain-containing protein [Methylorubrum extorquens]EHP90323.1 Sporulation domain-containing protein [Methylorubrum extorquens DSM 13060]